MKKINFLLERIKLIKLILFLQIKLSEAKWSCDFSPSLSLSLSLSENFVNFMVSFHTKWTNFFLYLFDVVIIDKSNQLTQINNKWFGVQVCVQKNETKIKSARTLYGPIIGPFFELNVTTRNKDFLLN